jgi:serine/threonine-protein kinase
VLLERIGEGGMGQVYRARQKTLNRVVALKVIRKECLSNPKVTLRFLNEIRAAGQLNHPHIVRAYDADQVDGTYYIAMEYIEGVDLAKMVKDDGPLPVNQACEYIRQAALGLQHACERGMVHRDIKPANILVTRAISADRRRSSGTLMRPLDQLARHQSSGMIKRLDPALHYPFGVVKILDMGLARCNGMFPNEAAMNLTQVGSVMGTPEFIAPEQARDSHNSDIRADLYSLGCTFYFLLTGQPPFPDGTLTEKLLQHQFNEADPVDEVRSAALTQITLPEGTTRDAVPAAVDAVIRKLLAKDPAERHQTPNELAAELQTIVQKMADGTLERSEELEKTPVAPPRPRAKPIINITPASLPGSMGSKVAVVSAALGGLACLACATVLAVLMSNGSLTRANTRHDDDAKPKVKIDSGKAK